MDIIVVVYFLVVLIIAIGMLAIYNLFFVDQDELCEFYKGICQSLRDQGISEEEIVKISLESDFCYFPPE